MTSDPSAPPREDGAAAAAAAAPDSVVTPGQGHLGPIVERFDDWVDDRFETIRGNPVADRLFTTASHLGDFSLIWQLIGATRGLARRQPEEFIAFSVLIGAESLLVNQGIKRLFDRTRPTTSGDERLPVRQPSTSSFPSGHASSAAFAALLLSTWDPGRRWLWITVATIVGTSRAYVRIHHASDVIAGAVVGTGLGLLARPLFRRVLAR